MTEPVPYLRLFGRLHPDNRLVLRPGYLTDRPRERPQPGPPTLVAEVYDSRGAALVRTPLTVKGYCGDGVQSSNLAVRGSVPLPPEAARVVVLRPDATGREPILVTTIEVPSTAPQVRILDAPTGSTSGRQALRWTADGDPPPVQYRVRYSHDDGRTWLPVTPRTTESEAVLDVDELPGGSHCRIAVLATNGVRSQTAVSEPFQVAVKPCRALIQRPADGERVTGQATLIGNGWWLEESRAETDRLRWHSDRDGELGHGRSLLVPLTPGPHRITLVAGEGDRAGEASVTVDVAE